MMLLKIYLFFSTIAMIGLSKSCSLHVESATKTKISSGIANGKPSYFYTITIFNDSNKNIEFDDAELYFGDRKQRYSYILLDDNGKVIERPFYNKFGAHKRVKLKLTSYSGDAKDGKPTIIKITYSLDGVKKNLEIDEFEQISVKGI